MDRFVLVRPGVQLPSRATPGSAGIDMFMPYDLTLGPGESQVIYTGVKVRLAPDEVVLSCDHRLIPNDGELLVRVENVGPNVMVLKSGEIFTQVLIIKKASDWCHVDLRSST